jgi:serine O-acetyltransferase
MKQKTPLDLKNKAPSDLQMPLRELLCHDHAWFNTKGRREAIYKDLGWSSILFSMMRYPNFRIVFLARIMRRLHVRGSRLLSRIVNRRIFSSFGSEISPEAEIGPGIQIPHPLGIVIGGNSRIGSYTHIAQFCTIGGNVRKEDASGRRFPVIGDYVRVMVGSVVAGPVTVGDRSIVAPNSVVVKDVDNDMVVSGNPAEPLKVKGGKIMTLKERITVLENHVSTLEKELSAIRDKMKKLEA